MPLCAALDAMVKKKTDILDLLKLRRTKKQISFAMAANVKDNKKFMIPTSVA